MHLAFTAAGHFDNKLDHRLIGSINKGEDL